MNFEFQEQTPASKRVALAEGLKHTFTFATMEDTKEIYYFDKEQGFYVPAETKIESTIKEDPACKIATKHETNEVLFHIQATTYTKRADFDNDLDWLHVGNGWVNIRTSEFEGHSAERLSLTKLPVAYDPNAKCPKIKEFLKSTLDDENIAKVVRMVGYCLLPNCKYQKAFMFVGQGSNGKSTLINLIEAFIGKKKC